MQTRKGLFLLWALCAPLVGFAADAPSVKVANAWARATAPGQTTAVAYVELTSDRDAALVAAGSSLAGRTELHSMATEGGVMRMRQIPRVALPAGQTVALAPNGVHLMLLDLKQPLKAGDKLPLVLSIQAASVMSLTTVRLEAIVRPLADSGHHGH
jgi:periplasmic copper chaperone A